MLKSNAPTKYTVAFAASGTKNTIPITTSTPGLASYTTGFPAVTMEPIASGGIPPEGQDFNGVHFDATNALLWTQSGFRSAFDATWAGNANIGGYPAQALICRADGKGLWLNTTDNNTTNPDAPSPSGWIAVRANAGTSTIAVSGATTAPDPSVLGVQVLLVTGTLTVNAALVLPLTTGASWIVENNTTGAFTLTVQGATGTGVQVAQGSPSQVFTDGTNFYATTANVSGLYLPIAGNAVSASKWANARTLSFTGDATGSMSVDGSANASAALTLAASGVTANTYGSGTQVPQFAVNAKGLITSVSNVAISFPVTSVFGRTGAVVLTLADVNGLGALTISASTVTGLSLQANSASGLVAPATQGAWIQWNRTAAGFSGEMDFVNNHGGGSGGWAWVDTSGAGTSLTTAMTLTAAGAITAGSITVAQNFVSNTTAAVLAATGAGTVVLRPNGSAVGAGQLAVNTSGQVNVGTTTAVPSLTIGSVGSSSTLQMTDTGGNGCGILITGNGPTTPAKLLRVLSGQLQFVNSANTAVIWSLTDAGGMTCATGTFTSSDENMKHGIVPVDPRPFHRLPRSMVRFDWNDEAMGAGIGTIAQDWLEVEPLYVGKWDRSADPKKPEIRLTVNQQGIAYEQSMWNGREIDKHEARLAALEARS